MTNKKRYYHHSTELPEVCAICNKHLKMYWKDAEQLNGFSDTTSKQNNQTVHYFCIPGAKTLQQINDERKKLSKTINQ